MAEMLDGEIEKPRQRVSNERKVFAGWRARFPEYLEIIWIIHKGSVQIIKMEI